MIQFLANRMADYVIKNDESADKEILAYGYTLIITGFVTYSVVLMSAFLFGMFREMLVAIGTFILMRTTIGGPHANSRIVCFITYSGTLYLGILLAGVITINWPVLVVLYIINIVSLILYAPGDTVLQPMVRHRGKRKILGLIFLTCLFTLYIFFYNSIEVNILIFISTATCVLLHPFIYKLYGCRRSH